jgi:hypothetical protein
MNTYAIVFVPDSRNEQQTVKEVRENPKGGELAALKKQYPGRVQGHPFVSIFYSTEPPALKPGAVVPVGYDPFDTDL